MSIFADQMLLRFLEDAFVKNLLENQLGLTPLFNLIYEVDDFELKEIHLERVQRRQLEMPVFETIRTSGTEERIMPNPERVQVNRAQPRNGRLSWVDVFLEILLATKVHKTGAAIERITVENLIEKLDGVASLSELKAKLKAMYPDNVVEACFREMHINSVEEFKRRGNLFLKFVYKAPLPYDPNDPQNARSFRVNVCVQFQPELKILDALQNAKLCRSILENERDFVETIDGGDIRTPYAFVVIFPENVVVNNAIPGLNTAQIKAGIKALFVAEKMLALFVT